MGRDGAGHDHSRGEGEIVLSPHFSPRFYCGLENSAAKLVSAEIALNILSSMPRLFPLATSLFAGIFVAS
jgi:hypothetical protein